jgi:hypothetical protein
MLTDPILVQDDRLYFLAYNKDADTSSNLTAGRISADGTNVEALPASLSAGTLAAGLTSFMSFTPDPLFAGLLCFLAYDSTNGTLQAGTVTYQPPDAVSVAILPIESSVEINIGAGRLALVLPGQDSPFLLLYATNMLTLWQIDYDDATGIHLTNVASLAIGSEWTSLVPLPFGNLDDSYAYFLAYSATTGEVEAGRINTDHDAPGIERMPARVFTPSTLSSSNLGPGYNAFVNYVYDGHGIGHRGLWLLGYRSSDGSFRAGQLRLDVTTPAINIYSLWPEIGSEAGYTALMPATLHNAPYFLAYKSDTTGTADGVADPSSGILSIDAAGPRPGVTPEESPQDSPAPGKP